MKNMITQPHRKAHLLFVPVLIAAFLLMLGCPCFADNFMDEFDSPTLSGWEMWPEMLNYCSLTDNPGHLRIYFNASLPPPSRLPPPNPLNVVGFSRHFFSRNYIFETKVRFNLNPISSPFPYSYAFAIISFPDLQISRIVYNYYGSNVLQWQFYGFVRFQQISGGFPDPDGTYYFRVIRQDNEYYFRKSSAFYSRDGIVWEKLCSGESTGFSNFLNNGISLMNNAVITAPLSEDAYVEYDYVRVSINDIKVLDPKDPTKTTFLDDKDFKPLLGQRYTFVAVELDGMTKVNANWTVTSDSSTMTTPNSALFPKTVGIFFDSSTVTSEKEFQIVHLGEAEISISDPNTKQLLAVKKIKVTPPVQLGAQTYQYGEYKYDKKTKTFVQTSTTTLNNYTGYDQALITESDINGVPPQYMKSHIAKETDPKFQKSYRYEPGYDFENRLLWEGSLYKRYKLDNGSGITTSNKKLRNKFYIIAPGWTFPLTNWDPNAQPVFPQPNEHTIYDTDTNVMCANIFYRNDRRYKLQNGARVPIKPSQRWSIVSKSSINNLKGYWKTTKSDFVAQTVLAASYGLFQMMYNNAVSIGEYTRVDNTGTYGEDPIILYDDHNTNIKVAATMYLTGIYFLKIKELNPTSATYKYTKDEWKKMWEDAFNTWNSGQAPVYGHEIIENGGCFAPQ